MKCPDKHCATVFESMPDFPNHVIDAHGVSLAGHDEDNVKIRKGIIAVGELRRSDYQKEKEKRDLTLASDPTRKKLSSFTHLELRALCQENEIVLNKSWRIDQYVDALVAGVANPEQLQRPDLEEPLEENQEAEFAQMAHLGIEELKANCSLHGIDLGRKPNRAGLAHALAKADVRYSTLNRSTIPSKNTCELETLQTFSMADWRPIHLDHVGPIPRASTRETLAVAIFEQVADTSPFLPTQRTKIYTANPNAGKSGQKNNNKAQLIAQIHRELEGYDEPTAGSQLKRLTLNELNGF